MLWSYLLARARTGGNYLREKEARTEGNKSPLSWVDEGTHAWVTTTTHEWGTSPSHDGSSCVSSKEAQAALPYPPGAKRIRFMPKAYTFHARNVYVLTAKRIRFTRDTYTLRPSRVYVAGERPCHLSPCGACEDGDKARENWG